MHSPFFPLRTLFANRKESPRGKKSLIIFKLHGKKVILDVLEKEKDYLPSNSNFNSSKNDTKNLVLLMEISLAVLVCILSVALNKME